MYYKILRKVDSLERAERFEALDYFYFIMTQVQNRQVKQILETLYFCYEVVV